MQFYEVTRDKKRFLDLLLLADEQEEMIDRYLERGKLFVLEEDGIVQTVCVLTDEGAGTAEIKNLATRPEAQRQGYGRAMVQEMVRRLRGHYVRLRVGTGESPLTLPFYEACGFERVDVIRDFFTDHYDHPIVEAGVILRDMVILEMVLA